MILLANATNIDNVAVSGYNMKLFASIMLYAQTIYMKNVTG